MIFGAQYYRPPFPGRECWERDLANMADLGFNTVKLWAVWNWIEPVRGRYDFSGLDELCGIAERRGLEVVINTIPEGAPAWILPGNEDALYRTGRGELIPFGGPPNIPSAGWPGLCMDKPSAADRVASFVEAVAGRYRAAGNVVALDVWNEPHLEPMFDYRGELLCYCDHSRAAFRRWLQEKYGDLSSLNAAWFRRLSDWSEVEPPPRFGTWADMLDWRLFWIKNLARHLRIRVEAARRGAPGKTIQTHVAYSATLGNKLAGGLGNELGDEFSLAREVDVFGLSSFPKWLQGKGHPFTHLAHNEVVAEAARGKRFYQVELQGGGGKAGLLGGEVPTGRDVRIWNYNTAAAGGKGVLYWQYAPEPAGLESPGFGLTAYDGGNTERSREAGACARELSDSRLDAATRVLPVNAIYISRKSQVLSFCAERREDLYAGSVAGIYRAAYEAGIPVRFAHEDYLDSLGAEGVRTLYVPMALCLDDRERSALRAFAEAGGLLVGEAATGMYDAGGALDPDSRALSELFGVRHIELEALPEWGFSEAAGGGCSFGGAQYRRVVEPGPGTEVTARFPDGRPAATSRNLGAGRAVYIATFAALGFHLRGDPGTRDYLAGFFDPAGYSHLKRLTVQPGKDVSPSAGSGAAGTASGMASARSSAARATATAGTADAAAPAVAPAPFAPNAVVRFLENPEVWILVVVNHREGPVRIELDFDPALVREASAALTVPGGSGTVRYFRKARA